PPRIRHERLSHVDFCSGSGAGQNRIMSLDNLILSVVERWWAGRYSERHAIVSSWDSKNHLAKVTLQPEGQETGWLPVETSHIGQNYGILIGLQPGQAGVNAQGQGGQSGPEQNNQGDQVIVR